MSSRQTLSVMLSFGYSVDWFKFLFSHVDAMGFNPARYADVIPNMSMSQYVAMPDHLSLTISYQVTFAISFRHECKICLSFWTYFF